MPVTGGYGAAGRRVVSRLRIGRAVKRGRRGHRRRRGRGGFAAVPVGVEKGGRRCGEKPSAIGILGSILWHAPAPWEILSAEDGCQGQEPSRFVARAEAEKRGGSMAQNAV